MPCARSSRTDGAATASVGDVEAEARRRRVRRLAARAQELDPAAAAVLPGHPRDEARDDLLQLLEQHLAVRPRLGERMREQVQHELLVRLPARVDADVREGCGGQKPAHEVERLRADGARVRRRRLAFARRKPLADPGRRGRELAAVRLEQVVERDLVRRAEARVAVIAEAVAVELRVVGDVAGRLLEVRGEPGTLEDLRQQVRRPLARDVRAAELRDRVVAVADEDPLEELGARVPSAPSIAGTSGTESANSSRKSRRSVPG